MTEKMQAYFDTKDAAKRNALLKELALACPPLVAGEYVLKNLRHGVILPLQLRMKRRKAGVAIRFH